MKRLVLAKHLFVLMDKLLVLEGGRQDYCYVWVPQPEHTV